MESTTTAGNSPNAGANAPNPNLEQLAAQLASKHAAEAAAEPVARPRGRPRLDGLPSGSVAAKAADARAKVAAPETALPPERAFVVDPALVQRLAKVACEGIEAWEKRRLFVACRKLELGGKETEDLLSEAGAPPGAIEVISACAAEIAQKYDWLSQWTPEAALLAAAAAWIGKDAVLFRKLDELVRLKIKANANATRTPAS